MVLLLVFIGSMQNWCLDNASAFWKTGQWSRPLFAWSKPVFDPSKACSRGLENSPFGLRQFKALILRFAKMDGQKPF
jgi:hypothetical protein